MITGSKELIREINKRLVLEEIINSGPISRADIAKKLGLTKATISSIVGNLLENNFIMEIGSSDTSKGRKPILISFNNNCAYAISVDIDTANVFVMIANIMGYQCQMLQFKTPKSPDKLRDKLIKFIRQIQSFAPDTFYGLAGITLGIHGVVYDNKIIFSPYYNFENIDLKTTLEEEFKVPVFLENEANLSVIGEYSSQFNYSTIACISVHSGIGLGLILDNHLYTGYSGYAGEFGHTIVAVDGKPCPCGNFGCLEQYCSERALLAEYSEQKGIENISFDNFAKAFQSKDSLATGIVDKFIKYMSICVNNILNTYNPEIIVINSSFTTIFPELLKKITDSLTSHLNSYSKIVFSSLQDGSILLGGIYIITKNYLQIENFHFKKIAK